ncbi:PREDICTED: piggyBac transposable element-derived protein 4-like [Amphimedon queenslandica]|uniref:PiggyBac transposable element-derived protein domain-containing protein n=1 Tax=Amphimedon queenslandica TaxID=400682 RepID=A0AAN0IKF2_AMPQE|nr:PREDICTED: piggyBac transposable element-derived protein 4-like [Amphimedon queenslandica]|eukprot:XP_011403022.1 PREDICTED: piggyBac transposable element-derived protein 4-like [Amphimedon queenslandica]
MSQFQVYVGREISPERGLGARVVKDLTRSLIHKYHNIFCDNFFSSIGLFQDLHEERVYATGTLRSDRHGFPTELKVHAKKGFHMRGKSESRQHCHNNLTVSVWQDTKPVKVCSAFCQTVPLDEVERKLKTGECHNFPCPHSINTYNKYIVGVDRNDQLREYYHVRLKSRMYYKCLFWMVFDVAVTNAIIIAKSNPDHHQVVKSTKAFRTALLHKLLDGYCSIKRKGRQLSELTTKKFCKAHYPLIGDGKQHRCYYCFLANKEKDTKLYCEECQVYLRYKGQETDCFLQYHKHHD